MPFFGEDSFAKLKTCHPEIQQVLLDVISIYDFKVLCGVRDEAAQEAAFNSGHSSLHWPESKHNAIPPGLSDAVDIAPWHAEKPHIRWEAEREFVYLAGHIMQSAASMGYRFRWGGDWDQDRDLYDINKPFDLGHFERIGGT